jgi:hypothetical protein
MDLSETEAERQDLERALRDAQVLADFWLTRCNGRDQPFVFDGEVITDSAIEHARTIKEESTKSLARLRAGVALDNVLS